MKTTTPPRRPPNVAPGPPVQNLLRIRLGKALQKHRLAAGLTQAELAELADLSLKYVGEIERGEANTTLEVLERLAAAVNWNPMDAFAGLREPISEGVRVMLIELLEEFVKGLQQAIRWLHALDPTRSRTSGYEVVTTAVPGAEQGNTNKPRFGRRLLGRKS